MRKKFVYLGLVPLFLFSALFGVRAQDSHDVAIVSVTPTCPFLGLPIVTEAYYTWTIDVNVVVRNEGDFSETFNVTAYYDDTAIGTKNVIDLTSGAKTTLTFKWNLAGLGWGTYTVSANASVVPDETDTEDNIYIDGTVKVKILGDISNDNFVDIDDLVVLGMSWLKGIGETNYAAQADVSFDGFIDVDDLVIATKPQNYTKQFTVSPSTVDADASVTNMVMQRKTFYANGRIWVLYSNGSMMLWKTSIDGSRWSSPSIARTVCNHGHS